MSILITGIIFGVLLIIVGNIEYRLGYKNALRDVERKMISENKLIFKSIKDALNRNQIRVEQAKLDKELRH